MAENSNTPVETVAVAVVEEKNDPKQESKESKGNGTKAIQIKHLTLPMTILSLLFSLPILFSVIWLLYMRQYDCEDILRLPNLQVGISIVLIFVFLVSNLVVYMRARFPSLGLLVVMVPLTVMFIVGLGLVGAYKMETRTIPGSPLWLNMKVHNANNWDNIKSCIYDTRTCDDLASRTYMLKAYDFTRLKLSYIESGCCKPPTSCDMQYINATFWTKEYKEEDSSTPYDKDCDLWGNEDNVLCYNCHACNEGFLRTLKGKWWKLGTFLVVMALTLIVSHLLLFVATMWERHGG
ncbi:hypothetical protein U1Q18_027930 [Sarracenia purpurea var. burkii]